MESRYSKCQKIIEDSHENGRTVWFADVEVYY